MGSQRIPRVALAWEVEREAVLKEEALVEGMKVPRRRKMAEGLVLESLGRMRSVEGARRMKTKGAHTSR